MLFSSFLGFWDKNNKLFLSFVFAVVVDAIPYKRVVVIFLGYFSQKNIDVNMYAMIPQSIKKTIALWVLNYGLKMLLSNPNVQEKQKQLVILLNTIIDALRDMEITEEELSTIKERLDELFSSKK